VHARLLRVGHRDHRDRLSLHFDVARCEARDEVALDRAARISA